MPQAGMPAILTNNRNRLSNATYDAAGNITQEYGAGFSYDAEGRLVSGSGSAYTYDGMGERVAKPGKLYWKGVGSTAVVETDINDLNPTKYVFFNGARIARIDPGTTSAKYYVTDNIGSTALVTDASGNVLNESLFFPYGVERVITQNDAANNYKFSGKERDSETGLDDFGARYYDSVLGRFMTPDWDAKAAAVPYAAFGDPQTLNLYAYVENGPLNKVDADGHAVTILGVGLGADGSGWDPGPEYTPAWFYEEAVERQQDKDEAVSGKQPPPDTPQHEKASQANGSDGRISINLTLGTTKVTGSYSYGPMPNSPYAGGVDINATSVNCNSCSWAQTVTRTGSSTEGPKKDGGGTGPLYGLEGKSSNYFEDRPATAKGGSGTFTATAVVGVANVSSKTFDVKGAMVYGYSVSKQGSVSMTTAPRQATSRETAAAVNTLQSHSPDWKIK